MSDNSVRGCRCTPFRWWAPNSLVTAYNCKYIVETRTIDAILAVDDGTASVMFGDEEELGTPVEDHSSMWQPSSSSMKQCL